ncbi:TonB-dependent vitamin B12 receptor [Nitrosomonas communis]|uniref:TonB-dependent vitamin B12 receptor n=1 Tax=Nitrosomonas communis TaxID=44574 RepID=UPI0026E9E75A|nr:TonB-dependent vitamin B12 receptor [Nitrosomonas communis]MCO6428946.1 TonB-dependent vitamin B12 receptor [Nitrosomonas communis]
MQKCRLAAMTGLWLAAVTTAATAVFAENIDHQGKPIIVTATRTAQTAEESLASVTVISRKEIERQQARSLDDLFRGVLGINVNNNGGPGKGTFVHMRGTESDHVLVLIDGIKAGSATSGTTAFENIPIEQIERIEIVRGPRSSLYGSEAIGGVIQIFTRKGVGEGIKPSFSFGGGSYSTLNGSVGLSGGGQQGWFNMTVSGIGTSGFNACSGSDTAGCFTHEPDRDGYRNVAGSARAGYRFQNGLEIEGNFMHSAGKTEFDGSFVNKSVMAQQVLGGSARFSPFDFWRINLIAGRSRDNSDNYLNKVFMTRFNTQRDTVTWQNDFTLNQYHQLSVGTDYQHDHVNSTDAFAVTSRNNWGVFAQHQAVLAAHSVQLSLRHDDNQQFGSRVTGGAGWGYAITDRIRLMASFGSAFKAPTFNELYFPGFGNANLRPEESRSFEFGARGNVDWGSWALNVYETRIDELIAFDASILAPANINEARIRGLEAVISTQIKGWQLNGNLTFLDPENRSSGPDKGKLLPRRAEQSFRLDIDRQFGRYRVGAMFLAEGERFDDLANTRRLDSYVKLDLRAEYILSKHWRLLGRIENLFNEHYETAAFFNQPGRNFFATLRYQP